MVWVQFDVLCYVSALCGFEEGIDEKGAGEGDKGGRSWEGLRCREMTTSEGRGRVDWTLLSIYSKPYYILYIFI